MTWKNRFYCGDNLHVLRDEVNRASDDLVYSIPIQLGGELQRFVP